VEGQWGIENGKWKMENEEEELRMENEEEELKMENGK
jgi:hypothetical protein